MGSDRRRSRSPGPRPYGGRLSEGPRIVDPFTMKEHVSFDYFCNWYLSLNTEASIDDAMQTRYDDYEHDLLARTGKPYVDAQISMPWFLDLYDGQDHARVAKQQQYAIVQHELEKGSYHDYALQVSPEGAGFDMGRDAQTTLHNEGEIMTQVLVLSNIPSSLSRARLETELRARVGAVEHLSISGPRPHDLVRTAWLQLKGDANSAEIRAQLHGGNIEEDGTVVHTFNVAHYHRPAPNARTRTLWAQLNDPVILQQHLTHLETIIQQLDTNIGNSSLWPAMQTAKENDLTGQVDLAVEYLRVVHFFDYWHLRGYDSSMDIQSHVPVYSRVSLESTSNQRAFDIWQVKFNQKLQLLLHPEQELLRMRVKTISETVAEAISTQIKQESEKRYRCQVLECRKLFEDIPFVQKHIEKRHGDWVKQVTQQAELYRRYMSDPNKLLPYKQFREPRGGRHQSSPTRNRRRSPRGGPRNVSHRSGRGEYSRPGMQNYRDLDKPAEELPELDY